MIRKIEDNNLKKILRGLRDLEETNPDIFFRKNARVRLINKITFPQSTKKYTFPLISVGEAVINPSRFAFAVFLFSMLLGTGTVYAAQSSLPTDTLYPLKIASEKIALNLAPIPVLREKVASEIERRRKTEQEKIQKQDKKDQIKPQEQPGKQPNKDKNTIISPSTLPQAREILQEVLEKTPEQAKPGLEQAIESLSKQSEDKKDNFIEKQIEDVQKIIPKLP